MEGMAHVKQCAIAAPVGFDQSEEIRPGIAAECRAHGEGVIRLVAVAGSNEVSDTINRRQVFFLGNAGLPSANLVIRFWMDGNS